jgi:hypothetical protein
MKKKASPYRKFKLRNNENFELPGREPGERIRTLGVVKIDRSVFIHTEAEKRKLKLEKYKPKRKID